MTLLFDRVLRHRCPNDVQALLPPAYDKFPPFERLDDHRDQVRAALWQFGGIITEAALYLRVDPARLRRFVHEIDRSLLEDIERIEMALTEYAESVLAREDQVQSMLGLPKPTNDGCVFSLADVKRRKGRLIR